MMRMGCQLWLLGLEMVVVMDCELQQHSAHRIAEMDFSGHYEWTKFNALWGLQVLKYEHNVRHCNWAEVNATP